MTIGTWLMSLAQPLTARIMIALGLSAVSIIGVSEAIDAMRSQFITGMGGVPGNILGLFHLAGGGVALGMILGAVSTRLTLWQVQKSVQFLGQPPT